MSRFTRPAMAIAMAASAGATGATAQVSVDTKGCRVIRILADGRRVETGPTGVRSAGEGASVSVHASSRGGTSSRSSVSASSSSGGSGRSVASASTTVDGQGRTVTRTEDDQGCTVVIDERADPGGRP